jgi:hypothetical protein
MRELTLPSRVPHRPRKPVAEELAYAQKYPRLEAEQSIEDGLQGEAIAREAVWFGEKEWGRALENRNIESLIEQFSAIPEMYMGRPKLREQLGDVISEVIVAATEQEITIEPEDYEAIASKGALPEGREEDIRDYMDRCLSLVARYNAGMTRFLELYSVMNPEFTSEVRENFIKRGYTRPQCTLLMGRERTSFIAKHIGKSVPDTGSVLIAINLPRPLARFWYRGGRHGGAQQVPPGHIAWGDIYWRSMPVLWEALREITSLSEPVRRMNAFGQHDPKEYYYVYEVGGVKSEEVPEDFWSDDSESELEK